MRFSKERPRKGKKSREFNDIPDYSGTWKQRGLYFNLTLPFVLLSHPLFFPFCKIKKKKKKYEKKTSQTLVRLKEGRHTPSSRFSLGIKSIDLRRRLFFFFFFFFVSLASRRRRNREGWIHPNCLPCLYIHHPSSCNAPSTPFTRFGVFLYIYIDSRRREQILFILQSSIFLGALLYMSPPCLCFAALLLQPRMPDCPSFRVLGPREVALGDEDEDSFFLRRATEYQTIQGWVAEEKLNWLTLMPTLWFDVPL